MFSIIAIASLPFLAQAAYLDPSLQQQQKPLLDHKTATERVVPLTVCSTSTSIIKHLN
jgi:hypothetical protein